MKLNNLHLILMLLMTVLLACEGEIIDISDLDGSIIVKAHIDDVSTGISDSEWDLNDEIGIFVVKCNKNLTSKNVIYSNERYSTSGDGSFTPAKNTSDIKLPEDGSKVDFIAYYPYTKSISSKFEYNIDVSNQDNQKAIDLLCSDNVTERCILSNEVDMTFIHQLTKLIVNISTIDGGSLKNTRAYLKGTDLKGKLSLVNNSITSSSKGIVSLNINNKGDKAEAIVIPTGTLSGITMDIINENYSYEFGLDQFDNIDELKSGTTYTFNVELDTDNSNVSVIVAPTSSIKPWDEMPPEDILVGKGDDVDEGGDNDNDEGDGEDSNEELGSENNPYTIDDAFYLFGEKNVWVKGYIVGHYTGISVSTFTNDVSYVTDIKKTCIALALDPDEEDGENTFPTFLKVGDMRDALNLNDNRYLIGTEVAFRGNVDYYYGSIGFKSTVEYYFVE